MSSNVRTTFGAEDLVRAAKASSMNIRVQPLITSERNSSGILSRGFDGDDDSGLGMDTNSDSLRGDIGIESGEEVERDLAERAHAERAVRTVARDMTLAPLNSRQHQVERRKGIPHTHTDVDVKLNTSSLPKANTTVKAASVISQIRDKHMNYASVSDKRLNEQPCPQKGEPGIVQYLLPNRDGDTGLHLAVILQDLNALDKLLQFVSKYPALRSSIDDQNNLFQTALHLALHTHQHEMVRKLVINGSSLHITDHKGNTPLHIACSLGSAKCLDEILAFSSMSKVLEVTSIPNNEGLTCVHLAASHGCKDTLRKLKRIGTNMNSQDLHSGKTALHFAAEKQELTDTHFLIESCGLDVDARTFTGCTPLHIAAGRGCIDTVAYLLSVGANPELQTDEGDTPLDLSISDDVTILLTKVATLKWLY